MQPPRPQPTVPDCYYLIAALNVPAASLSTNRYQQCTGSCEDQHPGQEYGWHWVRPRPGKVIATCDSEARHVNAANEDMVCSRRGVSWNGDPHPDRARSTARHSAQRDRGGMQDNIEGS